MTGDADAPDTTAEHCILLEYEMCTGDANHLETVIWTTAGILITGSLAAIGLLGINLPASPKPYDYLFRGSVGLAGIAFVTIWRRLVRRWYAIQRIMYARIVEIEEQLGMYKERYVHWLDRSAQGDDVPGDPRLLAAVFRLRTEHAPPAVRATVGHVATALIALWVAFMLLQFVAMWLTKPDPTPIGTWIWV